MKKLVLFILSLMTISFSLYSFACENTAKGLTFVCPDGAPALSISKFIADKENFNIGEDINYKVVNSSNIGSFVIKGDADIIVIPINAISKIYNANKDVYKTVSVLTHGNLYLVSKTEITLNDLKGKTVGVIGQGLVPDLTFKTILKNKQIDYTQNENDIENKVLLKYYSSAPDMIPLLKQGALAYGLLPEPAVSNLEKMSITMGGTWYRLDIQELYDGDSKSYPQAVLAIKESIIKKYPSLPKSIKDKFAGSVNFALNQTENAVNAINSVIQSGVVPSLKADMPKKAIENCNIFWQDAFLNKTIINAYLQDIKELDNKSANITNVDFYYTGTL